jgi:hypothetical protein
MINDNYLVALKIIYSKFSASNIKWYLIGKTNLALQGMDVVPSHLGILFHDYDLDKFLKLFAEFDHEPVEELPNGEAKEFIVYINQVPVLVCAEHSHGSYWQVPQDIKNIKIDEMIIPCFSLESEKEVYKRIGLLAKSKQIEEFLIK